MRRAPGQPPTNHPVLRKVSTMFGGWRTQPTLSDGSCLPDSLAGGSQRLCIYLRDYANGAPLPTDFPMTDNDWRQHIVQFIHRRADQYRNARAVRYLVTGSKFDRLGCTGLGWERLGNALPQRRKDKGVYIWSANLQSSIRARQGGTPATRAVRFTLTQDEWDDCHLPAPGIWDYTKTDDTYYVPATDWLPSIDDFLYHPDQGLYLQQTWCTAQVLHIAAREFARVTIPHYCWKDGSAVHPGLWNVLSPRSVHVS